jgi:arylsulfatase A-like enzyme
MNTKFTILKIILVAAVFFGCNNSDKKLGSNKIEKPNVLFISIDDLNDWLDCYDGHSQAITPNIDKLANRGMLFNNAHCQSPICQPSRSSLLSGLYPTTTGLHFFIPRKFTEEDVYKGVTTLPEHFSNNGYHTMGVGKISHKGIPELYDEFGGHGNAGPSREEGNKLSYPMGHPLWDWGAFPEYDSLLPDYKSVMWAIDQLENDFEKPFFLAVGFIRPHVPLYVPKKWFDMYPLDNIKLPVVNENDLEDISDYALDLTYGSHAPRHKWMVENNQWHHAVQSYLACISFVDYYLGKLLDKLNESQYADNTIVILWSDHGFHLGEKLRWEKRSLWQESTKVPLIFAGPGIKENTICEKPVELIDIFPTLNELCNLPSIKELEGNSLVPLLINPDLEWNNPAITSLGPDSHSVISEKWRFILYGDGSMELYNQEEDPYEWNNLAYKDEYTKIVEELKKLLPKSSMPMAEDTYDTGTLKLYK